MIQTILLIAAREFRQIAATRSFWITLLIIPVALAIQPVASHFMTKPHTETVMLIDHSGKAAPAITHALHLEEQRRLLTALSRYSERHGLDRADRGAPWAQHDLYYSDADVEAFVRAGGVEHATQVMKRAAPADTPPFESPDPDYRIVSTPPDIARATLPELARIFPDLTNPPRKEQGRSPLDYAIYVPADFGSDRSPVQIWSDGQPPADLMGALQDTLTRALRLRFLEAHGVSPAAAETASRIAPSIAVNRPVQGEGQEKVMIRSILPLLVSYLLLMSLMLSGSWMLQGTVEERSNKLIETVLACVSPDELMYGKLLGTVAVGLTMVAAWVACAIGAAFATQGMIADFMRPALAPLAHPGVALAMIYYFLAGYLMISMIFLTIGAMSDSFRDAQSYLSPIMLLIAMPYAIIAQAVLRDPSGLAVRIMSWIPIYTPFTMLARLGAGVAWWEVIGCAITLALFVVVEFVLLARVFRASLLGAGSKPNLARIVRLMGGRVAG